jgi:hypothetical protein
MQVDVLLKDHSTPIQPIHLRAKKPASLHELFCALGSSLPTNQQKIGLLVVFVSKLGGLQDTLGDQLLPAILSQSPSRGMLGDCSSFKPQSILMML